LAVFRAPFFAAFFPLLLAGRLADLFAVFLAAFLVVRLAAFFAVRLAAFAVRLAAFLTAFFLPGLRLGAAGRLGPAAEEALEAG
jgi:hypothetical protein